LIKKSKTPQLLAVLGAIALVFVLYFVGQKPKVPEKALDQPESTASIDGVPLMNIEEAKQKELPDGIQAKLEGLKEKVLSANPEQKQDLYKEMSSTWFGQGNALLAGYYARKVAEQGEGAEAWSITGTTFGYCYTGKYSKEEKAYCFEQAKQSFEQAIAYEPDNLEHKVNLCLVQIDGSPAPMQGILQLRDLSDANPEEALPLFHLGRLSIRTGQHDKAIGRLTKVVELEPKNARAHYLLAQAYEFKAQNKDAIKHLEICKSLSTDRTFAATLQKKIIELNK